MQFIELNRLTAADGSIGSARENDTAVVCYKASIVYETCIIKSDLLIACNVKQRAGLNYNLAGNCRCKDEK